MWIGQWAGTQNWVRKFANSSSKRDFKIFFTKQRQRSRSRGGAGLYILTKKVDLL